MPFEQAFAVTFFTTTPVFVTETMFYHHERAKTTRFC